MEEKHSILLVVQGGAGDVIASTPMIRGFRRKYPDDKIVVIATHSFLLEHNPHIDELISFDQMKDIRSIYTHHIKGEYTVRYFKQHFLYDGFVDDARYMSETLPEFICNMYNIDYDDEPLDYTVNTYERDAATEFMKQFQRPVVLVHPCGVLPMKSLDFRILQPIVNRLVETYDIVQIGQSGEPQLENVHNALGMPIRDTISVMPHAKLCILIESLFAHVTNALGTQAVVTFQSTDPKFFGYNTNLNVWDSNGCPEWPCNRPIGPLNRFLPAYLNLNGGESLPWMCPDPKCSKINPEDLEKTILGALEAKEKNGPFETIQAVPVE